MRTARLALAVPLLALSMFAPPVVAQEKQDPAAPAAPPAPAGRPAAEAQPPPRQRAFRRPAVNKKRKPNPNAAVATYPGFRIVPGGGSEVLLELSKKTEITEHKAQGRITYRIKAAEAPTPTNRLPLLTAFFPTAVSRVQLVEVDAEDLDLVIDLRTPSEVTHKLVESEGGVVLQVSFPPIAGFLAGDGAPAQEAPQGPKTRSTETTKLGRGTPSESPY